MTDEARNCSRCGAALMAGDAMLCAKCRKRFDPLIPPLGLLVKLGSIVVHVDEMLSPLGHGYDKLTVQASLQDPEVREWIAEMTRQALLPVKRGKRG
jgi:hypothetical protein